MNVSMNGIYKNFGKKEVLRDVSLSMNNGLYGLLGPNGAGKTTLIRILAGVVRPTKGKVLVDGIDREADTEKFRGMIGYLPQDVNFYDDFTALEYLRYVAALKGLPESRAAQKIDELAGKVGLTADLSRKCVKYSGGMKRRLGIAQALLNDPEILILDEPTAGLDPFERIKFRNIISAFSKDTLVLLSTHIVSDIDNIAREIIMIKDGRVGGMQTCRHYIGMVNGKVWDVRMSAEELLEFQKHALISSVAAHGGEMAVRVISEEKPAEDAVSLEAHMEDAYLYMYNYKGGKAA
jgi:ABC-2 type transport system ATP-binding protein